MAFHLGICDPTHQNLCYTNTLERFNVFVECFVENSAAPAIYEKGVNVNYKSILFYCLPPVSDTSCHHYLLFFADSVNCPPRVKKPYTWTWNSYHLNCYRMDFPLYHSIRNCLNIMDRIKWEGN